VETRIYVEMGDCICKGRLVKRSGDLTVMYIISPKGVQLQREMIGVEQQYTISYQANLDTSSRR